jgi:hypothetical protein
MLRTAQREMHDLHKSFLAGLEIATKLWERSLLYAEYAEFA